MEENSSRRDFLKAASVGAASLGVGLSGCISRLPGSSGGSEGGGGGSQDAGDSPGLVLKTLDVEGSPGGEMNVVPSGKVVLLDFFATWCAPCKPQMSNLRQVRSEFSEDEVFMASITTETNEEQIKKFWRNYKGTWPVAIDDESLSANNRFNINNIPTIVILSPSDSGHERVWRHTGLAGKEKLIEKTEEAL